MNKSNHRLLSYMKRYLLPSFEMEIKVYAADTRIELKGKNNWWTLIFVHTFLLITIGILYWYSATFIDASQVVAIIAILILLSIVSFTFNTIKQARYPEYIKEHIEFSKQGIYVSPMKGNSKGRLIKSEAIRQLFIVYDGFQYKFIFYQSEKPYFQFAFSPSANIAHRAFILDMASILGLTWRDNTSFDHTTVIKLERKIVVSNKKLSIDKKGYKQDGTPKKAAQKSYRPIYFTTYRNLEGLVIARRTQEDQFLLPKQLLVSYKNRILWHKKMLIYKEQFEFSEIADITYTIKVESDGQYAKKIVGRLYVMTKDKRRKKVFSIQTRIDQTEEMLQYEMSKEMEYLRLRVKYELKGEEWQHNL